MELLQMRQGESGLGLSKGMIFLSATCEVDERKPAEVAGALGVDLGVTQLAVDSDGEVHKASHINKVRYRHRRVRSQLQAKGTPSARRQLKRWSGKEPRFAKDTDRCSSKKLVAKAKDIHRALALENLGGIRQRVMVRRQQRATLRRWMFYQPGSCVTYTAKRVGVALFLVDARHTGRTCPACGHVDKANHPAQSKFSGVVCGLAGLADHTAAVNISRRAAVNPPISA